MGRVGAWEPYGGISGMRLTPPSFAGSGPGPGVGGGEDH